jgi:mRNA-degrading endonuclease RelE of RelBE toxin-antitoxin system
MPTKIKNAPQYLRDLRKLARKYPAIIQASEDLANRLKNDERPGDLIPNMGYEVYKVRLANPSSQRGKRGGFRAIYYVELIDSVVLVTIYSKTDQEDVSLNKLQAIIADMQTDEPNEDE